MTAIQRRREERPAEAEAEVEAAAEAEAEAEAKAAGWRGGVGAADSRRIRMKSPRAEGGDSVAMADG